VASEIFTVLAQMLMHTHPAALHFIPDWSSTGKSAKRCSRWSIQLLTSGERIGNQSFLAGPRPTVADCTLFALVLTPSLADRLRSSRRLPAACAPGTSGSRSVQAPR